MCKNLLQQKYICNGVEDEKKKEKQTNNVLILLRLK